MRLASQQDVDLLLADARDEPSGPFGAELTTLLDGAPCDVALLVAGEPAVGAAGGAIVVPFGGADDDWSALELGAWLATGTGALLALCGATADAGIDRRDASRLLATASLVVQQLAGVAAEPVLTAPTVEGIAEAAAGARAVVLGASPRWRSEGLGGARAAIAAAVSGPCVVVRRGLRPGGLSPPRQHDQVSRGRSPARPDEQASLLDVASARRGAQQMGKRRAGARPLGRVLRHRLPEDVGKRNRNLVASLRRVGGLGPRDARPRPRTGGGRRTARLR